MSENIRYNDTTLESPFANADRFKGLRVVPPGAKTNKIPPIELGTEQLKKALEKVFVNRM